METPETQTTTTKLLPALALAVLVSAALSAADLPFTVEATEDASAQFPGAPRVQSFSFAQWKGRWVIIGGRMAGYHSVGGKMAEFLRTDANRDVWVVDTTASPARTNHVSVDKLPPALAAVGDQWAATAQLYYQDRDQLYIAGGYGQDHEGKWLTFPIVSRVDLPRLIDGVMKGEIPADAIAYANSPLVQSSGGELMKLADGFFYVVMGHDFEGSYTTFEGQSEQNAAASSQTYLNEIRKIRIASSGPGKLSVSLVETYKHPTEFHRRDLNVAYILSRKGLGLAVYGGVFTPDTQLGFAKPIYLFPDSQPSVDEAFEQKMNAYSCAKMLFYDSAAETMYTTLFGGISRHAWDASSGGFVENPRTGTKTSNVYRDGLQWSDQVSTIRRGKDGTSEFVHPIAMAGFLGTNAVFIPNPDLTRAAPDTDILELQSLKKRTLVGYVYGGIRAAPYQFPYMKTSTPYNSGTIPSKPSDLILRVFATVQ
jgi:hypothetical protein